MNIRPLNTSAALAALALAGLGIAACGGGDDSSSSTSAAAEATTSSTAAAGGEGSTIKVAADPNGQLAFTKTQLTAKAGSDTVEFDNQSTTQHNVEIEDANGEDVAGTDTIAGATTSTTADLQPGTYTFYCSIPGHREAGMEGTITVK